jgi:hypothetical protein
LDLADCRPGNRRTRRCQYRAVFTGLRREAAGERLGVKQVLFALLARERPDPAAELFHAIGVDRMQVRNRLRET